ncbi:MAG: hypothetical protein NT038_10955 [Euryarchaeota archaeon]|nr:hypothetical protein [Euryarchaeota archaeon]
MKKQTNYYGIVSGKWESLAYAIYAFLTRKVIFICEDKPLRIPLPLFFSSRIKFFKNVIGRYKGKYYELNKQAVFETKLYDELELEKNPLICLQNKVFNTNKTVNFYKHHLSIFHFEFLRDLFLIRQNECSFCLILPKTKLHSALAKEYLKDSEYRFSSLLTMLYIGTGILAIMAGIFSSLFIKPVRRKPIKGLVLKELVWSLNPNKKGFQDNFLVDGNIIKESDYVYYKSRTNEPGRMQAYKEAKQRNYDVIILDRLFNINSRFFKHIKNNILFLPCYIFGSLTSSSFLLPYLAIFLSDSIDSYRLYSFCDVSYHHSINDYDDIVSTMVANQLGIKVFLYHWSDLTVGIESSHQHIVHNDLFLWGPIMKENNYRQSRCENVYCIGCNLSNNYNDTSKKELRKEMGLDIDKPVIAFYDSDWGNDKMYYSIAVYEDFIQTIVDIAKKKPDVQVVFKPKFNLDEKNQSLLKKLNVKIFYWKDVFIADVLRSADVNVSMGMNSTTTLSLLCGIPGLYYDTTENHLHPLTKYEGQLVFRDRKSLIKTIDGLIAGTITIPEIPELKEYNIFNADPINILRHYVKYGKVDERYRIKS